MCKSCVVFALLPTQCIVCVSPVLCLLNVLPAQFAMQGLQQVVLLLLYFAIFYCTTASTVCCVCVCTTASAVCCVLCLHYCQRSVLCVVFALLPVQCAVCASPMLCLHYYQHSLLCVQVLCCVCTTARAVCCVCKSYVVFALLPAQCAVCVSPVLC